MSYSHRDKVPTTIGAKELNFRVRYGNGCDLLAIIARLFFSKTKTIIMSFSIYFKRFFEKIHSLKTR